MPKVRRENLPRSLFRHLIDRVFERHISTGHLELLFDWLETEPEVPEGRWFKRFPGLTVCGEGELIKTFLRSDQAALAEGLTNPLPPKSPGPNPERGLHWFIFSPHADTLPPWN